MNSNDIPNSDVLFTEAPASWNTRYITPEGFECQLTLRGETGQELLEKASGAITHLQKMGCKPYRFTKGSYQPSSNHQSQNNGNSNGDDRSWCPIHNCAMKRWEKDGRVWFSHIVNGEWCSGKPKKK